MFSKNAGTGLFITAVRKNAGKKMLGQDDFFVVILSVIIIIIICGKEEHFIDSQIDKFFFLEDQNGK